MITPAVLVDSMGDISKKKHRKITGRQRILGIFQRLRSLLVEGF